MKKLCIICLVIACVCAGCTPKSQLYKSAKDILARCESVCDEISQGVEKLDDEYTTELYEKLKLDIDNIKKGLSSSAKRDDIEDAIVSLSRIEKELGSIKTLSGDMDDYAPYMTEE